MAPKPVASRSAGKTEQFDSATLRQDWEDRVAHEERLKADGANREVLRDAHRRVMLAWARLIQANGSTG